MFVFSCSIDQKKAINNIAKPAIVTAVKIYILPLGDIPNSKVAEIEISLHKIASNVTTLSKESMPRLAYYKPRNRYRADKIISILFNRAKQNEVYIGITTYDISSSTIKKGVKIDDYGIMGLGYRPGKSCIVSNYRLKDKSMFYKVVLHELGHTQGLPHCLNTFCFMQDADSKDNTRKEKGFCSSCKKKLIAKGFSI